MTVEERLRSLNIALPPVPQPVASYVPAVRIGNLVFTSGMIPMRDGEVQAKGKVGLDLNEDEAYEAARVACLNALSAIQSVAGDLSNVKQIVRVNGYVNSEDGFTDQPTVVNGASDLLVELFGEAGKHSRTSIGVDELPLDAAVEIDMIVELKP